MKSMNHSQGFCPKCGHKFSKPQAKYELNVDKPLHTLRCIRCSQPITGAPLSFCGGFACEPCVIAYYQQYDPNAVTKALQERRICAARLLRPNSKL